MSAMKEIVARLAAMEWLGHISPFWTAVGATTVGFLVLLSILIVFYLRSLGKPASREEIQSWSQHDSYYVFAASCLWKGLKPVKNIPPESPAYEPMQFIKSQLESRFIESMYQGTGMMARVTKQDLIKIANKVGARPKFLFPN